MCPVTRLSYIWITDDEMIKYYFSLTTRRGHRSKECQVKFCKTFGVKILRPAAAFEALTFRPDKICQLSKIPPDPHPSYSSTAVFGSYSILTSEGPCVESLAGSHSCNLNNPHIRESANQRSGENVPTSLVQIILLTTPGYWNRLNSSAFCGMSSGQFQAKLRAPKPSWKP